jgi:hypothetical protein
VFYRPLNDPGDEAARRCSPVRGVLRIAFGEPGFLADRLEPEDDCEHARRNEDKRRAMKRQSEAQHKEPSVDGMTGACVDARGSKCRTVTRSRQRGERPSEGDPAEDQDARAGCFEHEADDTEPGLAAVGPARAEDGEGDRRGDDDRLQDDPAFTASAQRRWVHAAMLRP